MNRVGIADRIAAYIEATPSATAADVGQKFDCLPEYVRVVARRKGLTLAKAIAVRAPSETDTREWRAVDAIAYDATARLITLVELGQRECKWPVSGEKADTRFCGHVRLQGPSYCPHHDDRSAGRIRFVAEAA